GSQKPDVSIFRTAMRALDVDPGGCWHVGDNYRTDVLGARAAGIRPVLLLRTGRRHALSNGGGGPAGAGPARPDCPTISDLRALVPLVHQVDD
ncbi:MAG TPA: HAD hydrolase-like protein, partial [Candidatus Dormibacteraeota bacterium]|nr:HAD hydrolase-like protein [Candidatus Dormibacteraeota bacterium]